MRSRKHQLDSYDIRMKKREFIARGVEYVFFVILLVLAYGFMFIGGLFLIAGGVAGGVISNLLHIPMTADFVAILVISGWITIFIAHAIYFQGIIQAEKKINKLNGERAAFRRKLIAEGKENV